MIFPYSFPAGAMIMLPPFELHWVGTSQWMQLQGLETQIHPPTPALLKNLSGDTNSSSWPRGLSSQNTPRLSARLWVCDYQFGEEFITYRIRLLNPEINCKRETQGKQKIDLMVSMGASIMGIPLEQKSTGNEEAHERSGSTHNHRAKSMKKMKINEENHWEHPVWQQSPMVIFGDDLEDCDSTDPFNVLQWTEKHWKHCSYQIWAGAGKRDRREVWRDPGVILWAACAQPCQV